MVKQTIPQDSGELEEMLSDTKRMQDVFNDPQKLKEFIQSYSSKAMTDELRAQVKEAVEAGTVDFVKNAAQTGGVPRLDLGTGDDIYQWDGLNPSMSMSSAQRAAARSKYNPGAPLDRFKMSLADFGKMSYHGHVDPDVVELRNRYRNAYSTSVPSEGGFLVPETLAAQLLMTSLETSIMRPLAMVVPMTTQVLSFPAVDDSTHADGTVYGGIAMQWAREGETLTASNAKFGRIRLEANKLAGFASIPNEMFSDSLPAFQAFLETAYPRALAHMEDSAFLTGDGVGKPLGILNAPSRVTVTKETGQAATTIVWENIVKMYARMLPSSLSRGIWIANNDTFAELFTMAMSVGTGGGPEMFGYGAGSSAPVLTILGRPLRLTEKSQTLGTEGDLAFVDPAYYLIGDRKMIMAESSPHYQFGQDSTAYRITERVDGQPWLLSAITPEKSSATMSAYVTLATRS